MLWFFIWRGWRADRAWPRSWPIHLPADADRTGPFVQRTLPISSNLKILVRGSKIIFVSISVVKKHSNSRRYHHSSPFSDQDCVFLHWLVDNPSIVGGCRETWPEKSLFVIVRPRREGPKRMDKDWMHGKLRLRCYPNLQISWIWYRFSSHLNHSSLVSFILGLDF